MKNLILKNIGLKITSVLLAVIFWFFVTSRGQSEMSLDVPLEFRNIPAPLGIVTSSARTVSITVRGQDRLMKNLRRADVRATIDLGKAKRGEASYMITASDITVPHPLATSGITPSSIKVRLDEMVTKTVKVVPVLNSNSDGKPVDASWSVEPASVKIKGFKSDVRGITALRTEPIETAEIVGEKEFEVGLDTGGAGISAEPETVKVKIVMRRKKA